MSRILHQAYGNDSTHGLKFVDDALALTLSNNGIHPYDSIDLHWERRSDAATEALIGLFIRYPNAFSKLDMGESAIVRYFIEALEDRRGRCKNLRITALNLRLTDTFIERDDIQFHSYALSPCNP